MSEPQWHDFLGNGGRPAGRRFEFGKIGQFDRICSPRALAALVWRDGGGLVYLVARLPWYSRHGFEIVETRQEYPAGWCWRFMCLRIRWRWPTFKRSGWLEPRQRRDLRDR